MSSDFLELDLGDVFLTTKITRKAFDENGKQLMEASFNTPRTDTFVALYLGTLPKTVQLTEEILFKHLRAMGLVKIDEVDKLQTQLDAYKAKYGELEVPTKDTNEPH